MTQTPDFYENLAKLVCNHFIELPKTGKPIQGKEWTTLSAIVKSVETSTGTSSEVVAMATGTKCLGESELNPGGIVLSDSHAEILTRRAFLLYLYNQIELCLSKDGPKSVLDIGLEADPINGKYPTFKLRPEVKFHLFVSHVPCGDASVFTNSSDLLSHAEAEEPPCKRAKEDPDINRNRTGAKLVPGANNFEAIQAEAKCRVKPGKGPPTLCMSCSDKLAKWTILGLQGSLLSNLIPEPIRLSSIVIGTGVPFNKTALERAVYGRFENELTKNSKFSIGITPPKVFQSGKTNFMSFDDQLNPAPGSIIWVLNEITKFQPKSVQVSVSGRKQGITKKLAGTPAARLNCSRKDLFLMFASFLKRYNYNVKDDWTYKEAKGINNGYRNNWDLIKSEVMIGWTKKPENIMGFGLE